MELSIPAFLPSFALALVVFIYTIATNRDKVKTDRVNGLSDKVTGIDERLARVEGQMQHAPDRETVHKLELAMAELKGDIKNLSTQLQPIAAISNRLQDHLIDQGKK